MDTELVKKYELFETPAWAAEAILDKEMLTERVIDPCVGTGVLSDAAKNRHHVVDSYDIHNWGYRGTIVKDFLSENFPAVYMKQVAVLMNPPFNKAEEFVRKALVADARKVICFQRFAWWESNKRRDFWKEFPPNRVYLCGSRASCWRADIPEKDRKSSTPTAHAWFVWEPAHPAGTVMGHIYK